MTEQFKGTVVPFCAICHIPFIKIEPPNNCAVCASGDGPHEHYFCAGDHPSTPICVMEPTITEVTQH